LISTVLMRAEVFSEHEQLMLRAVGEKG
jgi:hypothetical protein